MSADFPDKIHLERLRERLWHRGADGGAAVMVGSGFSRNAKTATAAVPPFPLWREISDALIAGLTSPEERSGSATSTNALRLASEFKVTFGRTELDALLLREIPDRLYVPGPLHTQLLTLPWTDVFTTNYDTLLERALSTVYDRKYQVLLTAADIPGRRQPRIVKLHGSFPSQRPFIITEDDYRTYPSAFAPFVNTVQQSLMENAFVLVGFSGGDPNFLHWTGWVRDNLGRSTPPIYLCGVLGLGAPARRLLMDRGVIPIDLWPAIRHQQDANRSPHTRATEWLMSFLEAGRPPSRLDWPMMTDREADPSFPASGDKTLPPEQVRDLREAWSATRLRYPRWEVAPYQNRQAIWQDTRAHVEPLLASLSSLPPVERLETVYELIWRLDTALVPLLLRWMPPIISALEATSPPAGSSGPFAAGTSGGHASDVGTDVGRASVAQWIEVAFSVMREARDDLDSDRFTMWAERVMPVAAQNPDWAARLLYERALFDLLRVDHESVERVLRDWPAETSPFWNSKKAALLAEIGEVDLAQKAAQSALDSIRGRQALAHEDFELLSQEGWTLQLIRQLKLARHGGRPLVGDDWTRRDVFEANRCDPVADLRLQGALIKRPEAADHVAAESPHFDPDRVSYTYHLGGPALSESALASFAFLRMLENGALPYRAGRALIFADSVAEAAEWISELAPLWSLGVRLRTRDTAGISRFLDRTVVRSLDEHQFRFMFTVAASSLRRALTKLESSNEEVARQSCAVFSEILSRLVIRARDPEMLEALDLATRMYQTPNAVSAARSDELWHLFRRTIGALPPALLLTRVPALLSLPLLGVGTANNLGARSPEPFDVSGWPDARGQTSSLEVHQAISGLIDIASSQVAQARRRATIRLVRAYEMGLLSDEEETAFGVALWSRIDPTSGLPIDTGLRITALLQLPRPSGVGFEDRLREYLRTNDFRQLVHRHERGVSLDFGAGPDPYAQDLLSGVQVPWIARRRSERLPFSADEAALVLHKATRWWDHHHEHISPRRPGLDFGNELQSAASWMMEVLTVVVLSRLHPGSSEAASAARVLREMEAAGITTLAAAPFMIPLGDAPQDVRQKLRRGMFSSSRKEAELAVVGTIRWLLAYLEGQLAEGPSELLVDVGYVIATRCQPALRTALLELAGVIRNTPDQVSDPCIDFALIGLKPLISETSAAPGEGAYRRPMPPKVAVPDRPELRAAAANLAAALSSLGTRLDPSQRAVVDEWRTLSAIDPLPEVRTAWLKNE